MPTTAGPHSPSSNPPRNFMESGMYQSATNHPARELRLRTSHNTGRLIRVSAFLLAATMLAGCEDMARNGLVYSHRDSFVHESDTDPTDNISDPLWARRINNDRAAVKDGSSPQKVVDLDIEMARMMAEAQAIVATKDQARAQAWMQRYGALNHEMLDAQMRSSTAGLAAGSWSKGVWVQKGDSDPCIALNGQNLCQRGAAKNYQVSGPKALQEMASILVDEQRQRERMRK